MLGIDCIITYVGLEFSHLWLPHPVFMILQVMHLFLKHLDGYKTKLESYAFTIKVTFNVVGLISKCLQKTSNN